MIPRDYNCDGYLRHTPKLALGLLAAALTACAPFQSYSPEQTTPQSSQTSRPVSPPPVAPPTGPDRFPPAGQHTNNHCIAMLKHHEGLRLEAYRGPSGAWLIGYGHMAGVRPGMKISAARAEEILLDDLREFERNVSRLVKVEVSNNGFSALVCLSYNIGWGNFGRSTVLKKVNARQ